MIPITLITIFFLLAISFDITPYLRGPSPYPPEWRWAYLFVNTLDRIWLPVLVIMGIIALFIWTEKKKVTHTKTMLILLVSLSVLFQLSVLFYSRSGIPVLVNRIINPELNGYFTAALSIKSVPYFLAHYNDLVLTFVYHAKAHPPGAILFFYYLKELLGNWPLLGEIAAQLSTSHSDVGAVWNVLHPAEKATALFAGIFVPFLSALSLIPLYYAAVLLYGRTVALRSTFLYLLIPSLIFFIPINDAFLQLFSVTALFFMSYGLEKNKRYPFFLSGATLFLGVFFNLSLLPLLIFFFLFFLLRMWQKKKFWSQEFFVKGSIFSLGFFLPPILLLIFAQFNFIQVIQTIMKHVPDVHTRSYTLWIFYNLYDFLIFSGIPVSLVFLSAIKYEVKKIWGKTWKKIDPVLLPFLLMILILNFSGSVRAETGRLWSVYIPFMVLLAASYLTNKMKFSKKLFIFFLLLQGLQILVMQEFWVMLW